MRRSLHLLIAVFVLGGFDPLNAEPGLLFDFETKADTSVWRIRKADQDGLEASPHFSTQGKSSIVLITPKWQPGMDEWPVWEAALPVKDWSAYDRIAIDFTNPTGTAALIRFKAADDEMSKLPGSEWAAWSESVPPRSHLRVILPLEKWFGARVDRSNMKEFLFYTARAEGDFRLHVDNMRLLKPDEEVPPLPKSYLAELVRLRLETDAFSRTQKQCDRTEQDIKRIAPDRKETRQWAEKTQRALREEFSKVVEGAKQRDITVERILELGRTADLLGQRMQRLSSLIPLRERYAAAHPAAEYLAGWALPTEKVLPEDMPVRIEEGLEQTMSLARNESESRQIVVLPFTKSLKNVRVEVGKFTSAAGDELPSGSWDVRTVGYVKTKQPAYAVDYVGWWPDPLLDFLPGVTVEEGRAQSFWLRARAPKEQPAGWYEGHVRVLADNAPETILKLRVHIRKFVLPDRSPLPLATQDSDHRFFSKYSDESWDTMKGKVADFLASYYIDYDDIYRAGPPDWDILQGLHDQGKLEAFSLSTLDHTVFKADLTDEQYQAALAQTVAEIQPGYDEAKQRGLLPYAYLYGMDEVGEGTFPMLKRVTEDLKKTFPEIPIMTTAMDFSYGEKSGADAVDIWVPIIHEYQPEKAAAARQKGKKVWWYTCQSPAHPYPNIFTEYPAMDIRLMMGAMAAKYQPDGFLYYCTFRDQGPPRKAVDSGPYTEWDACAFIEPFNGEGYLAYPGPNGRPLASLRLENFRDGLEDYAYWKILQATVEEMRSRDASALTIAQRNWLKTAGPLLEVPESLVKSSHEYSLDSSLLESYREQLAEALEAAPGNLANPWPEGTGFMR